MSDPLSPDATWLASRPATPFFCEENVWHLCRDAPPAWALHAVVITNADHAVAMWGQRAASADPIVWDYHVIAIARHPTPIVLDVDGREHTVLPLPAWLRTSFRGGVRDDLMPRFRVMPAAVYADVLASDRRHMRDADGAPTRPFPPWPPPHPERPNTLGRLIDVADDIAGIVLDLAGLARTFGLDHVTLPALENP
jgi:protein N-terminal glutamine amidohydrolase